MKLLLLAGLLSFLALGTVSIISLYQLREDALNSGNAMSEAVSDSFEDYAVGETKEQLLAVAHYKALQAEKDVFNILEDAENSAGMMTKILAQPDAQTPRTLSTPTEPLIPGLRAYIYFDRGAREQVMADPDKRETMGVAANIGNTLETIARHYSYDTSCYVALEDGYLIWADSLSDGKTLAEFPDAYRDNSYVSNVRPWYRKAKEAGRPVVTDVYMAIEGESEITCAVPFYRNGQFMGVAGISTPLNALNRLVQEQDLGEKNINFVLDDKGCVAIMSQQEPVGAIGANSGDLRAAADEGLAQAATDMVNGNSGATLVKMGDKEYVLAYAPMPTIGWSFGTLSERDKVVAPVRNAKKTVEEKALDYIAAINQHFFSNIFRMLLVLGLILVIMIFISLHVAGKIVKPILVLTDGVKEIAKGNLDKKLQVQTGDEIEVLADSVNDMTRDLKSYMENLSQVTAEKERIATELDLAANIQEGMIPHIFPAFPERKDMDIFATMETAKEVGGDFYDFYLLDDTHLAVTMADVSGKGIGAALFMVVSKTILGNCMHSAFASAQAAGREPDYGRAMEEVNRCLCDGNEEDMFVTVFFGVLNLETGVFSYVNSGHNPPLLRHDGQFSYMRMEKKNILLGIMEEEEYDEYQLLMAPGDMLYLYTDGVTEAMDEDGVWYSEQRLLSTLNDGVDKDVHEIIASVRDDVKKHVQAAVQSDDITMLALEYKGKAEQKQ